MIICIFVQYGWLEIINTEQNVFGFLNVTVDNNCISVGREHKDTNVALDNDWLKIYI